MERQLKRNKNWIKDLFKACWGVINFTRSLILNIIFLILAIFIIAGIAASGDQAVIVESNSVLKLNLVGEIVEEKTFVDPYSQFMADALDNNDSSPEILLTDILTTIKKATTDNRINALLIDVQYLRGSGLNKLQEVGHALQEFKKTSNKPVLIYGDYFSQSQYYIAAHADEVVLHPMGAVAIDGFARYRMYLKSALEKLKINTHIFRVGTYKSAVEPFIRDDMSEAAKLANQQWLGDLWSDYKSDVSAVRGFTSGNFDEQLNGFLSKLEKVNGSLADFAIDNTWVDKLMTHQEFDTYVNSEWISEDPNFIDLNDYLTATKQPAITNTKDKVGIIVAKGTIYDGSRTPGDIGGDSTAKLLKQAREDDQIKAIVLRVDSPGGSAFASEVIRNEIEAIRAAGKPIIVSMSSMAASGGYWISASTDEIWASPTTITGSIGIFGMLTTFENTLSTLGITTDGVGTTEIAGFSPTRALNPVMGQIIQTSVEHGYDKFISLVAKERNMTKNEVDNIAQGRVWSGKKAFELGLVDKLGYYQDAIDSAAKHAELTAYQVTVVTKKLTPYQTFINDLFAAYAPTIAVAVANTKTDNGMMSIINSIMSETKTWTQLNDPVGMYLYCYECDVN
jgi:protease-4